MKVRQKKCLIKGKYHRYSFSVDPTFFYSQIKYSCRIKEYQLERVFELEKEYQIEERINCMYTLVPNHTWITPNPQENHDVTIIIETWSYFVCSHTLSDCACEGVLRNYHGWSL